jgi:hypothetical protein
MNPLTHPRWLLHAEGGVMLAASILAYHQVGGNWWLFALLFFTPDISALGYLFNVRIGATCYNVIHVEVLPAALALVGFLMAEPFLMALACIWFAHIGMDRLLGFGLKYPTRFPDTHLQHV